MTQPNQVLNKQVLPLISDRSNMPPKNNAKILVCITEDWFALSHFVPLLETLASLSNNVTLLTNLSDGRKKLHNLGIKIKPFNYHRSSTNPVREFHTISQLTRIFETEKPDIVHLIALKPLFLGSRAAYRANVPQMVLHLTGTGSLNYSQSAASRLVVHVVIREIAKTMNRPGSWLIVENMNDAMALTKHGAAYGERITLLGGAGVDPDYYQALQPPENDIVKAGFLGRMQRSKGVDDLMTAWHQLRREKFEIKLELYGKPDETPAAIPKTKLQQWAAEDGVTWHGHVNDVRKVWRQCDIAVVPSKGGEGMPRAMLEAASCARPLIVADVAGCHHFVRDGREGLIVPPNSPRALASALKKLALDRSMRVAMGNAARQRVCEKFTSDHVRNALRTTYLTLIANKIK